MAVTSDGVRLHVFSTPAYVRDVVRPRLAEGAEKASRVALPVLVAGIALVAAAAWADQPRVVAAGLVTYLAGVLVLVFLLLREVSILATPLVVAMFPAVDPDQHAGLSPGSRLDGGRFHPLGTPLARSTAIGRTRGPRTAPIGSQLPSR